MTRRIRIGIDTGGTFTDVVAFDEDTGELVTTKTPSTPGNPADGFMAGIDKVLGLLGLPEGDGDAISAVSHGTTVATNQLLEGKVDALGYITTEGYEAMLEIARQSVPDGYGNSYFWVKPDRIVPAAPGQGRRWPARLHRRRGAALRRGPAPARWPAGSGTRASPPSASASCTPTPTPSTRSGCARCSPRSTPTPSCRCSSEVLREYREYERAMTTLVDAAVKPRLSAYVTNIKGRLAAYAGDRRVPFYVMKSNGGVLSADEVVHQPITTVLSGPAAGALGAALIAQVAGLRQGAHQRRRRHLHRRQRGHRRRADADHRGHGRRVPVEDPDDRRRHRRRRRRLDRLALARGHPQGRPAVGGRRPRAALLRQGRRRRDDHRRARRARPDPAAPARRRDPARRRRGPRRRRGAGRQARPQPGGLRDRRPGDLRLEPGQRAAPGHRQARARRPRLHADHVRRLGLAAAVPADGHPRHPDRAGAAEPRQRVGVRAADRRREERLRADPRRRSPSASTRRS